MDTTDRRTMRRCSNRWLALVCLVLAVACGCDGSAASSPAAIAGKIDEDADAALGHSTDSDRQAAADRLVSYGAQAESAMARVLIETDDVETKRRMIDGLVAARAYDSVPTVIDTLEDASPEVRARASEALITMLHIRVRYDPNGPEAERAAATARYRDYYDRLIKTGIIEFEKDPQKADDTFRERTMFSRPVNEVGARRNSADGS